MLATHPGTGVSKGGIGKVLAEHPERVDVGVLDLADLTAKRSMRDARSTEAYAKVIVGDNLQKLFAKRLVLVEELRGHVLGQDRVHAPTIPLFQSRGRTASRDIYRR